MTKIKTDTVDDLRLRFRGKILLPGEHGYEGARQIWNGMFDRKPATIARCVGTSDVIHAVINLDMIAWDGDEDMVVEIHSSFDANSNVLSDYIVVVNDLYDLLLMPTIEIPGTSASDHSRFWNNDYSAVLLIEEFYGGDFNPYYHTEEDRIAILNMPYFHEMTKLSIGSLASLAVPIVTVSVDKYNQSATLQLSNFPNPFSSETNITYTLDNESYLRISIVNSLGKEIRVLENGVKQSGIHQLHLQVDDLPGGMYFLCAQLPNGLVTHKMLIE